MSRGTDHLGRGWNFRDLRNPEMVRLRRPAPAWVDRYIHARERCPMSRPMSRGTVKWFDEAKGLGFFQPDIDRRGKTAAENLKALD